MTGAGSLFDTIDIDAMVSAAEHCREPGGLLVAALVQGILARSEDRLVLGSQRLRPTVTAALPCGWTDETPARALAVAYGLAAAIGDGGRVWCLLDAESCDEGGVWEAARLGAPPGGHLLAGLLTPTAEVAALTALWTAAGWKVVEAAGANAWEIVGGLDQLLLCAEAPGVLLCAEPVTA